MRETQETDRDITYVDTLFLPEKSWHWGPFGEALLVLKAGGTLWFHQSLGLPAQNVQRRLPDASLGQLVCT